MKFLITLAVLCVSLVAAWDPSLDQRWERFKAKHGKGNYLRSEEIWRRDIWEENVRQIDLHNLNFLKGEHTYTVAENHFADMSHEEFLSLMTGAVMDTTGRVMGKAPVHDNETTDGLPSTIDYREQKLVSEVKNQGRCGSCYAFSTTGSLEGQHAKATGELVSLSEQNIVDCSGEYGNHGCRGGFMNQSFQYIIDNDGIDTEQAYPYQGRQMRCRYTNSTVGARMTSYVDVKYGSEAALQNALASVGPIAVAIDAGKFGFKFYRFGVYKDNWCSRTHLNHGVLAVGYGRESGWFSTNDYWLVKNSWGTMWGQAGYIKMGRNKHNMCGIATAASYPVV